MKEAESIDLALGVLDHQLLDCERRRCGKVDDLELDGIEEGRPGVAALLVGPSTWRGRGRLGRLAAWASSGRSIRVAWTSVKEVDSAIHLRERAGELGLGRGDDRARSLISRLPGSK
jgi:sporulation protein YlmC with PRC-barrel domain